MDIFFERSFSPGKGLGYLGVPRFESPTHWAPQKKAFTLPETNIASENEPLEKEIPIGNLHF